MLHGEKDGLVNVQDTYDFFKTVPSSDKQMKRAAAAEIFKTFGNPTKLTP